MENDRVVIVHVGVCRGESYAGIYVPMLVQQIMQGNEVELQSRRINLKGFAVSSVGPAILVTI